jgi:prepilin-type N-terminal cleavage/methylation domain-containing protein
MKTCETTTMTIQRKTDPRRTAPGFSLVELLVVITIIALVIGIVLPALGFARDLSKKTSTSALINQVSAASAQYKNDNRRNPGYFTPRQMGDRDNADLGMSGAENLMLDLAYPKDAIYVGSNPPPNHVQIGPVRLSGGNQVWIDPDAYASNKQGAYFTPTNANFKAQPTDGHQIVNDNGYGHAAATEDDRQLKDLVDAWGQPLLVWSLDEQSTFAVTNLNDFAREFATGNEYARYYVNQNRCFTNATAMGKRSLDQTDATRGSILATGVAGNNAAASLSGLLGQPSSVRSQDAQANYNQMLPTQGRGTIVIHSAGSNGYYMGRRERGAKEANNILYFGLNFKGLNNQPLQNDSGVNQATDLRAGFDDLVTATGN